MDQNRVNVSDEDIRNWYIELEALCFDISGAFIFNVDETGCCDWVDAHDVKVLVPSFYSEDTIKIPVDRNSKRATLIGCISADGTVMKPMILLSRKTIEEDIFLSGYNESNVLFAIQNFGPRIFPLKKSKERGFSTIIKDLLYCYLMD